MKKNFVKKLALAMALVVTATSVNVPTVASAAEMPGFKSTKATLKVGETKTYGTKNNSEWSFYKARIGNTSVATLKHSKAKKLVKITGVKAGNTQVRAYFKNYKTKKVYSDVVLKVNVVEDALKLESVQATGVKKLVVTFNKAVDDTKATIDVKRGNATVKNTAKWADDKKSVTLNMENKLTEAEYTVTVSGVADTALTGSVAVKDETLTSIEFIGNNLVITNREAGSSKKDVEAVISYKTLNQYGERMAEPGTINPASSFGKAEQSSPCTTSKNGEIKVTITADILKIETTKGSVTLVDNTKGITVSADVVLSAEATPKNMTIAGLYNLNDAKFADMVKGDDASDFVLLAQVTDQYGNPLDAKDLKEEITPNFVPGMTGLSCKTTTDGKGTVYAQWTDKTIDGVDYVALGLSGTAEVGSFYVTFVNPKAGLLANQTFTVGEGTVIKSVNVYETARINNGKRNELGFEIIDANGNAVTKFSELDGNVIFTATSGKSTLGWEAQTDGSAKLIYTPSVTLTGSEKRTQDTFSVEINKKVLSSYTVKTVSFNVYEASVATKVVGFNQDATTAVISGEAIALKLKDVIVEDQYGDTMSAADVANLKNVTVSVAENSEIEKKDATISTDKAGTKATTEFPVRSKVYVTAGVPDNTVKTLKLSINLKDGAAKDAYELDITVADISKVSLSSLKIDSVNDGFVVKNKNVTTLTKSAIAVVGSVAGQKVDIPAKYFGISNNTGSTIPSTKPETTETGKISVTVTIDGIATVLEKEYKYSNATPVLSSIIVLGDYTTSATTLDAKELRKAFWIADQYGDTDTTTEISYNVKAVYSADSKLATVTNNNTAEVKVTDAESGDMFVVTAIKGTKTATNYVIIK